LYQFGASSSSVRGALTMLASISLRSHALIILVVLAFGAVHRGAAVDASRGLIIDSGGDTA
jgi:hypothetical protein